MIRKQARRRKSSNSKNKDLFTFKISKIFAALLSIFVLFVTYKLGVLALDREITSIEISAPFQRVSALNIEDAISEEINAGFIGADIDQIKDLIVALPWIDQARIARRWPSNILINVTEQIPAAVWHEDGLLNTRGELFLKSARHIPAELPRLSGPNRTSDEVAHRYLKIREQLISRGLDLRRVDLSDRGSWEITLINGVNVRFGSKSVDERINLFFDIVTEIIVSHGEKIKYIDMRYGNGFAIAWNDDSQFPKSDPENAKQKLLMARGEN